MPANKSPLVQSPKPPIQRWPYFVGPFCVAAFLLGMPVISHYVKSIESPAGRFFVGIVASCGWGLFWSAGVLLCIYCINPTDSKHHDS